MMNAPKKRHRPQPDVIRVVCALWGAVWERDWRLSEIAAVLEGAPQESPGNFVSYCSDGCGRRATASITVQAPDYGNEQELREARAIECIHKNRLYREDR